MSKGIIVVDMPANCAECDIEQCDTDSRWCGKEFKDIKECFENKTKPDWCPIIPLPEKIQHKSRQSLLQEQFAEGWNAFIDEICKGE